MMEMELGPWLPGDKARWLLWPLAAVELRSGKDQPGRFGAGLFPVAMVQVPTISMCRATVWVTAKALEMHCPLYFWEPEVQTQGTEGSKGQTSHLSLLPQFHVQWGW